MKTIKIGDKTIGEGSPSFIIGEIGSNHNRDKKIVKALIDYAVSTGFDAVKFQTYEPLEVFSTKITTRDIHYEKLYGDRLWWEVARDRILMPREWFREMFDYAANKRIMAFSTVHSIKDAEFLMQFNPPVFKVASIDVTYLEFLKGLAQFKKPIILSTGMAYLREIEEAVDAILSQGNTDLALLHCVSCYPPKPNIVNLRNITTLKNAFDLPVGFSDHAPSNTMAAASIALGSCIIEKHITLDRTMEGPDHPFALDPAGMQNLVVAVREVEEAFGSTVRTLSPDELESRRQIHRSIVARTTIKPGDVLTRENVKMVRPGTGLAPKTIEFIQGKKARVCIDKDEVIELNMLESK
jgi:N,N'-diacetyllegionaminate synthase